MKKGKKISYSDLTDTDMAAIGAMAAPSRLRRAQQADHYARTLLRDAALEAGDTDTAARHQAALDAMSSTAGPSGP